MHFKKNLFFLFFLLSPFVYAQPADQIINRYITFIGGQENWKKLQTLITAGEYDYGGIKFPFRAYAKAPDQYKFIVPFEGKYYAQAFDGKEGWKIDAFKNETGPTFLMGKDAQSMANESDVALENVFINYKLKGHQAILEGKDTIGEKVCHKIKFVRKNGEVEVYYFDSRTAVLVMKSAPSRNAELQGEILTTTYFDYRNVDGIRIPFKSVSKLNDQSILEITIDKAEVNIPIDNEEFHFNKE